MNDSGELSQKHERIESIDIARGLAILGILLVNMAHFSYPDLYLSMVGEDNFFTEQWSAGDLLTSRLLDIFIQTKFITMFSFLFGFGMVIMMDRTQAKGQKFVPIYVRRLLALLLFGTVHAFIIWDGDILTDYALLGFLLLLFHKCKPKTLVIWAVTLFTLFALMFVLMDAASIFSSEDAIENEPSEQTGEPNEWTEQMNQEAKQAIDIYSEGTFMDIAEQRIHDRIMYMSMNGMLSLNPLLYIYSNLPYFTMFLLGAAFAKLKVFHQPTRHRRLLKRLWLVGLCLGLPFNVIGTLYSLQSLVLIGAPLLMLFYVITLLFMSQTKLGKCLVAPLSAVGKTAFSNYVLQSVIGTFIFYHYGLGWYGSVYPLAGLGLTVIIFIGQMIVSNLWLKYFRMGPLEWIWRSITYWKRPPLRAQAQSSTAHAEG